MNSEDARQAVVLLHQIHGKLDGLDKTLEEVTFTVSVIRHMTGAMLFLMVAAFSGIVAWYLFS